jgi:hypothetical protein
MAGYDIGTEGGAMQHKETERKTAEGEPAAMCKMAHDEAEHLAMADSDCDERENVRKQSIERRLFLAMFAWLFVMFMCNGPATPTNSNVMGFMIYTGSPIVAGILAGIAVRYYPASRRFLKWLAVVILVAATYLAFMVCSDAAYHGFSILQSAAASPSFWLFFDLVVLGVLYLLVPEKAWRQNRRTVLVTLVLLLVASVGGYFLSLSGKGAVRLQTGYDLVAHIKTGTIQREHVPDCVLNRTDTCTMDFSETVTLDEVSDTRTIYVETTFPGPTPRRRTVRLYLCQPLTSRGVRLSDRIFAYSGPGYPQLVKGRSYLVTGVLEKAWQSSPWVFVLSAANIQEQ